MQKWTNVTKWQGYWEEIMLSKNKLGHLAGFFGCLNWDFSLFPLE